MSVWLLGVTPPPACVCSLLLTVLLIPQQFPALSKDLLGAALTLWPVGIALLAILLRKKRKIKFSVSFRPSGTVPSHVTHTQGSAMAEAPA